MRDEERERPHRDAWGNWEFAFCEAHADGRLRVPEVDEWLRDVAREPPVRDLEREPRWPGGAPFAVCLTHDVDVVAAGYTARQTWRLVRARATRTPGAAGAELTPRAVRALGAATALVWQRGGRAPDAGPVLEACVDAERRHGVTGSYFVPVHAGRADNPYDVCVHALDDPCTWRGRRHTLAEVLRELAAEGFDVGLHGSYASATDGGRLAEERERLATALDRDVHTTRQHWLHWDVDRTPALQEAAGLRADSTLGFNRDVGFRAGTSLPFRWADASGRELDLVELPLVIQEAALTAANALELGRDEALATWARLLGAVRDTGGVMTLLVHPHALADPTVAALYARAIADARDAGAWIADLAQVDAHWRAREARLGLAP